MHALIVDAEELFSLSLSEILSASTGFDGIQIARDEHEFLGATAREQNFELIFLHPMSLGEDGGRCVTLARRLYPDANIFVFRRASEDAQVRSLNSDKVRYISRNASVSEISSLVRTALNLPESNGETTAASISLRPAIRRQASRPAPAVTGAEDLSRLSYRQSQILAMAADGLPNKEIAARLEIAEGTVKAHMHAIFKVLGVTNRTQAVIRFANLSGGTGMPVPNGNGWGATEHRAAL